MKNQLLQSLPFPNTYNIENIFSLFIQQNTNSTKIKMLVLRDPLNTADIPHVFDVLKNYLPSVLTTECFNDENLPFYQEVKKTEIGHLFEHILLEYMCQAKITKGYKSAVYAGRTRWNWKRDPKGLFHIHISCTLKDHDLLPAALNKSIALMKIILKNNTKNTLPSRQLPFFHNAKPGSGLYLAKQGTNNYVGLKNGKRHNKS